MTQKRGPKGHTKKDIRVSNLRESRIRKVRLQLKNARYNLEVQYPLRIQRLTAKLKELEEVKAA